MGLDGMGDGFLRILEGFLGQLLVFESSAPEIALPKLPPLAVSGVRATPGGRV